MQRIILASASPRRRELMTQIGLPFEVQVSEIDESLVEGTDPAGCVCELARKKAMAIAGQAGDGIVIGADTIVVAGGRILGKPVDADDAVEMLKLLSAMEHLVLTGVALIDAATRQTLVRHETTKVVFKRLTAQEINGYIASGEPFDKAGAYGIQGLGAVLVREIHGCYFNVVGLPVAMLADMLRTFGVEVLK